jgi:hypothetical protein
MTTGNAIFLDTTIQIARVVHGPAIKQRIEARLREYTITVTGEVVKQEFKRRLLKEASYLLGLVDKYETLDEVFRHARRLSHPAHKRKLNICLDLLGYVFENAGESEIKERFRHYLHYLITLGLRRFERSVGHVIRESGCACAKIPVVEKQRFKRYEFGPHKCSEMQPGQCTIAAFVQARNAEVAQILQHLRNLAIGDEPGGKSPELMQTEAFIARVLESSASAHLFDPCYTVGDLLIALESSGIPTFYTINGKESQHLSRTLQQDLVVLKSNPETPEVECLRSDPEWTKF